jgi:DNA repair protein RadD
VIELRPYQETFICDIRAAMRTSRRVVAVAATGSGKTVCFSFISNGASQKGNRVLIVAHRMEILRQISKALNQYNLRHGWICPGRTMTDDFVQIGMIQTISKRLDRLPEPNIIILDESHHAVSKMYLTMLEKWFKSFVLGVTATPLRLDGKGLGSVFDTMVIGPQTRGLIDTGFLAPFNYLAPELVSMDGVKSRMGDYATEAISEIVDQQFITGSAVKHYQKFLHGKTAIAFCITVDHARHVAEQFSEAGIPAASIDGTMTPAEREKICSDLASGEINVMTSCELVSEGFDCPSVSGCIMLRPTKSLSMYLQMIGRVLRLKSDGGAAIILDHVGNINRHGMPNADRIWSLEGKKKKDDEFKTAKCKNCFRVFAVEKDWKLNAECGDEIKPGCALYTSADDEKTAGDGRTITEVDGELRFITDQPEWAGGISIARAAGAEYKAMLRRADSIDKLKEIAKVRGYNIKWVYHILRSRDGYRNAAE